TIAASCPSAEVSITTCAKAISLTSTALADRTRISIASARSESSTPCWRISRLSAVTSPDGPPTSSRRSLEAGHSNATSCPSRPTPKSWHGIVIAAFAMRRASRTDRPHMPRRKYTVQADKLRHKRSTPPPEQPWVWFTREMLESEAWSTAPINTRRLVERIILEHMAHAGTENGRLICTYRDFERHGIGKRHIAGAVEDAASRGLIVVTERARHPPGLTV